MVACFAQAGQQDGHLFGYHWLPAGDDYMLAGVSRDLRYDFRHFHVPPLG